MTRKQQKQKFQRVSVSKYGMVSTAHFKATEAGAEILAQGGNAFDAAVSSAFALGVCEPHASGLGGQTMMLLYTTEDERIFAIDGSSRIPNRAVRENFADKSMTLNGFTASTVPSTAAVLDYVRNKYGTMKLSQILGSSIRIAEDGYEITPLQNSLQKRELKSLLNGNAASIFLQDGQKPYKPGTTFMQPLLAKTLKQLSDKGIEDFYTGDIAEIIHHDMQKHNGLIHKDDLSQIPYPIERDVLSGRYGKYKVYTMPPPGAGRTLVEMLSILRRFRPKDVDPDTKYGALLLAETMRRAQLDRRDRPYDPSFYPQVEDEKMLSPHYTRLVSRQIEEYLSGSGETTHLSVMDRHGNIAALTQSIERVFGAKVVSPDLGFLYNNYLSAVELQDIENPYYLRPNGVPWASVAPTIIFKDKKPWLAIGSPGSQRIAPSILQVFIRLSKKQPPLDAVSAPRMHCSYNGKVSLEAEWMRDDIPQELEKRGYEIDVREPMSFYLGCIQMVLFESGEFIGVADPRRDGTASGPIT
jgi:gamma-glutamyltranspeptidase/glutathione hydrolase